MAGYGSFCPIAKATEVLAERWTLLVMRELLLGARHFNDIRRGVPRMSPTLLSKRLHALRDQGIVAIERASDGHCWEYRPTAAGEDLRPVIELVGHWGQRWVRSRLPRDELDPGELMWYIHRHFVKDRLPPGRVVIEIDFTDVKRMKRWWVVIENGTVDLCLDDPGYDVDVVMTTDLRSLTQVYIGDLPLERACAAERIDIQGARELVRGMPRWFARSKFADDNPISPD
ncbi:MAG TPA: helix-turn-helix domain-containing protein [Azospirillum sp.]|nr:helix-turn-helix domain-containing protein [Azospirillum sp.]